MRETLFQAIVTTLKGVSDLIGEDGTIRVYDYPNTAPPGYPYAVVGSDSFESVVLDNARDSRRYSFKIQVVGEKFGDPAGLTQSDALQAMRKVEDNVMAAFDANYYLGLSGTVIRSFPTLSVWGLTDGGSRIVLDLTYKVDTLVNISG